MGQHQANKKHQQANAWTWTWINTSWYFNSMDRAGVWRLAVECMAALSHAVAAERWRSPFETAFRCILISSFYSYLQIEKIMTLIGARIDLSGDQQYETPGTVTIHLCYSIMII